MAKSISPNKKRTRSVSWIDRECEFTNLRPAETRLVGQIKTIPVNPFMQYLTVLGDMQFPTHVQRQSILLCRKDMNQKGLCFKPRQ